MTTKCLPKSTAVNALALEQTILRQLFIASRIAENRFREGGKQ